MTARVTTSHLATPTVRPWARACGATSDARMGG